jgi:hypothetical protein
MKKASLSALFLVGLLRAAVAADLSPPQQFEIYYGSSLFGFVTVELQDGQKLAFQKIDYRRHVRNREEAIIEPSAEAWARFRRRLDRLDVWNWKESYSDPGVLDGTGWRISLKYKDRMLDASGSNAYPLPGGASSNSPKPSPHFNAFLQSVQDLIGRKLR